MTKQGLMICPKNSNIQCTEPNKEECIKGVCKLGADWPITVSIKPDTCPDCGHPVSKHGDGMGLCCGSFECRCKKLQSDLLPAEPDSRKVEKHCTHPDQKSSCYSAGCGECEYEQVPQMPLIELADPDKFDGLNGMYVLGRKHGATFQRDADMAWHNEKVQQVRKEFADTIISEITRGNFENDSGDLLEPELIAYIRAMAEGGR